MCKLFLKHDISARRDPKLLHLMGEMGYEGLGMFWALAEYLAEHADSQGTPWIPLAPKTIRAVLGISSIKKVERLLTEFDLFITEEHDGKQVFTSRRVKEQFAEKVTQPMHEVAEHISRKRSEAGSRGGMVSKGGGRPKKDEATAPEETSKEQANDLEETSKNKQTEENKQAKNKQKQANDLEETSKNKQTEENKQAKNKQKTSKRGEYRGDKSPSRTKDLKTAREGNSPIAPEGAIEGFEIVDGDKPLEDAAEASVSQASLMTSTPAPTSVVAVASEETYSEAMQRIGVTPEDYDHPGYSTSGTLLPVVLVYNEVRREYPDLPPAPDYATNMFYQAKELIDAWQVEGSKSFDRERLRKALRQACTSTFLQSKKNLWQYMWLTKLGNLLKIERGDYADDTPRSSSPPQKPKPMAYSNAAWEHVPAPTLTPEQKAELEELNATQFDD